ncbi:Aquaporin-like protein [Pleurostoma richardsiae]|uniref:Aquaporin-like protein n=1 Tax=Pleurostoma richardsiae TaxID=41990 RepID=A0AA38VJ60_9PEZI|nr:Aquaporin-like protein [Pleurostoma richardsiae]
MAPGLEDDQGSRRPPVRSRSSADSDNDAASRVPSTIPDRDAAAEGPHQDRISSQRYDPVRSVVSRMTDSAGRPLLPDWRQRQPPPNHLQLGWVDEDYYEENPWYGQANKKPIFSLGKPLPHKVRRGYRRPKRVIKKRDEETGNIEEVIDEAEPVDEIEDHRPEQEHEVARTRSDQATRTSTRGSAGARHIQRQQEMMTSAGAAHSEKRNDAGQPVFDYIPEGTDLSGQPNNSATRTRSGLQRQTTGDSRRGPSPRTYVVDKAPLGHEEQPAVEEGEIDPDELRNWWARLRSRHPEPLAEFLATGVAVMLGLASTLSVNLSASQTTKYGDYETACWAWGFAWMFGIYLGGGVSGAHMNPAVSICLSIFRGFPWRQCAIYTSAQFVASLAAGGLAYGIYADSIRYADPRLEGMPKTFFSTPQEWVSLRSAFANQVVGSAVMMIAVLALGDDQNNPPGAGMHALVLGLLVTTLKFTLGYNTGSSLNPASDFGPRVVAWAVGFRDKSVWQTGWWFYGPWLGTVVGSVLGCVIYDAFVFVGSESPVNYKLGKKLNENRKRLFRVE